MTAFSPSELLARARARVAEEKARVETSVVRRSDDVLAGIADWDGERGAYVLTYTGEFPAPSFFTGELVPA